MKTSSFLSVLFGSAILTLGLSGCAHRGTGLTPLPDSKRPAHDTTATTPIPTPTPEPPPGPAIAPPVNPTTIEGTAEGTNGIWSGVFANGKPDTQILKADTVYFDFDSATIKKSEEKKLEEVSNYLKNHQKVGLRVEGNCDERGTEKYNLSLGQKRAGAVREYLLNLGINAQQVITVSFGALRPAVEGHDEKAWSKNRRDDFVVLSLNDSDK